MKSKLFAKDLAYLYYRQILTPSLIDAKVKKERV